jgi:hypothetical protein
VDSGQLALPHFGDCTYEMRAGHKKGRPLSRAVLDRAKKTMAAITSGDPPA